MDRAELLDTLKSLVEAKLEPTDWLKWWEKNGKAVEKLIGSPAASRLKPNYPDSPAGAAHNSQTEAMAILKEARISVKRSMRYHKEFAEFMERYIDDEEAREKEKASSPRQAPTRRFFTMRIARRHQRFSRWPRIGRSSSKSCRSSI